MVKKNWPTIFTFLVVFVDFLIINLSFYLAIYLRFPDYSNPFKYIEPWIFINVIFLPLSIALGVYRGLYQNSLENQKVHLKKFTYYLGLFTMSYLFMVKGHEYSRGVVIIFLMTQYILLEISRSMLYRLNRMLVRKGFGQKKTIIVGSDESAKNFVEQLQDIYGDFYHVQGFLNNGKPERDHPAVKPYIIGKQAHIDAICRERNPEQIFIVSDSMLEKKYDQIRQTCEKYNIRVKMVSPDIRNLMNQIKVRDVTGVPLTTGEKSSSLPKISKCIQKGVRSGGGERGRCGVITGGIGDRCID